MPWPWTTDCDGGDADKEKSAVVLPQDGNLKDARRVLQSNWAVTI